MKIKEKGGLTGRAEQRDCSETLLLPVDILTGSVPSKSIEVFNTRQLMSGLSIRNRIDAHIVMPDVVMKETPRRQFLQVFKDVIAKVPAPIRNPRVPHQPTVAGNDPVLLAIIVHGNDLMIMFSGCLFTCRAPSNLVAGPKSLMRKCR